MRTASIVLLALALACNAEDRAPGASLPSSPWPGPEREALVVPDAVWDRVKERTGFSGRELGRTPEEMSHFTPTEHILRRVRNVFDDARNLPEYSGKVSDGFVKARTNPAGLVASAFQMLDIYLQGECSATAESWGADWLPGPAPKPSGRVFLEEDALPGAAGGDGGGNPKTPKSGKAPAVPPDPDAALPRILKAPLDEAQQTAWNRLPVPLRRLAIRLYVGAHEADLWVRNALPEDLPDLDRKALLELAVQPWVDRVPVPRASWRLMDQVDRNALAYGSVTFLRHLGRALQEYHRDPAREAGASKGLEVLVLETPLGRIRIGTEGPDAFPGGDFLVVDPGGDDRYAGANAASCGLRMPVACVVDLGGNDAYEGEGGASLAAGLLGIGVLLDAAGNDTYHDRRLGQGAGLYGMGGLFDLEGDDRYDTEASLGQGAGCFGVGILADLSGKDEYLCRNESQGFAATGGVGVLIDGGGDDRYVGRDDGPKAPDLAFKENALSLCQGCGFGRRADASDGRSLGGGIGVFLEVSGNDVYDTGCYSGGSAYWWGLGIFEDLAGDDTYDRSIYCYGASPHFGAGVCVDRSGDDTYNPKNGTGRLCFGAARDGGLGWFIEADGNDRYRIGASCGGASSLNGIGVFWDRRGDDRYQTLPSTKAKDPERNVLSFASNGGEKPTPENRGTDRAQAPDKKFGSFRDRLMGAGIFLDTGGKDAYLQPEEPPGQVVTDAAENSEWQHVRIGNCAALGIDVEGFSP